MSRSQALRSTIWAVPAFRKSRVAVIAGGVALLGVWGVWLFSEMGVPSVVSVGRAGVFLADQLAVQGPVPSARRSDLDNEMARLSAQLQVTPRSWVPSRNPFAFEPSSVELSEHVPAGPVTSALPPLTTVESAEAPVVSITLAGVGTELGPAERPRTAILSAEGRVVLGRVGDEIAGRYQVRAVASDTVELLDLQSGAILHLTLP